MDGCQVAVQGVQGAKDAIKKEIDVLAKKEEGNRQHCICMPWVPTINTDICLRNAELTE